MLVRLKARSFIQGGIHDAGEILEVPDKEVSEHMEPVKAGTLFEPHPNPGKGFVPATKPLPNPPTHEAKEPPHVPPPRPAPASVNAPVRPIPTKPLT